MATNDRKKQTEPRAHPKGRGREHVEQSHETKQATAKAPALPKRFSHSAMGNR